MPTQELGAPAFRKYDIEAWMPGRESYGEVRKIVAVLNDVSNLDSSALDFICICICLILALCNPKMTNEFQKLQIRT